MHGFGAEVFIEEVRKCTLLIIRKPTYVLGVGTRRSTDTQYVRRFTNDEEWEVQ